MLFFSGQQALGVILLIAAIVTIVIAARMPDDAPKEKPWINR